jgi:hypothetical protein
MHKNTKEIGWGKMKDRPTPGRDLAVWAIPGDNGTDVIAFVPAGQVFLFPEVFP